MTSFLAAYEEYHEAILFHAERRSPEPEDVAQDTWIEVWKSMDTYDSSRPLWNWIYGIMVHRAYDNHRKRREWLATESELSKIDSEAPHSLLAEIAGEDDPEPSTMEWAEDWLRNVGIPSLPPKQRLLAEYRYIQKETERQIASRFAMSFGGVTSGLNRARKKLIEMAPVPG